MPAGRPHEAVGNSGPRWMTVASAPAEGQNPAYRPTRPRHGPDLGPGRAASCRPVLFPQVRGLAAFRSYFRSVSAHDASCQAVCDIGVTLKVVEGVP